MIVVESLDNLQTCYRFGFLTEGKGDRKKVAVLAGGSNVFFTRDFEGTVILIRIGGIVTEHPDNNPEVIEVTFGAGLNWDESIRPFIEAGWGGGLENLSGIPGSVGAAPIQNIGAYGVEQDQCFVFLRGIDIRTGQFLTLTKEDCRFGYRDSIFKQELKGKFIITEVCYRFRKNAPLVLDYGQVADEVKKRSATPVPLTVREAVIAIRQSKLPDPKTLPNAGSFFKNPIVSEEVYRSIADQLNPTWVYPLPNGKYKISAGGLIEACGLKGVREGNVGTYEKQALVIVKYGEATGKDVGYFSELIARKVYETFRIRLEREVNRMN
jgi:UDP-N-acetylmuramate dehydrogenase